ncbi:ATP-binding protein [Streptomyces sp. NPDC054933]
MALVAAQEVPTSSTMALPHGPAGVGAARRRLREELCEYQTPDTVVDDAVLVLSELLSNACRHGRPINGGAGVNGDGEGARDSGIRAAWRLDEDGLLTLEVTDGGGPTRPKPSSPSLTARGGRGLGIVGALSLDWGVRDRPGEVTVWAVLPVRGRHARRDGVGTRMAVPALGAVPDALKDLGGLFDDLG